MVYHSTRGSRYPVESVCQSERIRSAVGTEKVSLSNEGGVRLQTVVRAMHSAQRTSHFLRQNALKVCPVTAGTRFVPATVLAAFLWLIFAGFSTGQEATLASGAPDRLRQDLAFLASDELTGRGVGTPGIELAGEFIAKRFKELGLDTTEFDGTPFQKFTIPGPQSLGPVNENTLQFANGSQTLLKGDLNKNFTTMAIGKNGRFDGPVVFAGYGITATELNYDDYANIDVEGKVVIVIRKEPQQDNPDSKFDGRQNSPYAYFTTKELNAAVHKVAALILVNDRKTAEESFARLKQDLKEAEAALVEVQKLSASASDSQEDRALLESRVRVAQQHVAELTDKVTRGEGDALVGTNDAGNAIGKQQVPTFYCSRALVDQLLKTAGKPQLSELEDQIDRDATPHSFALEGVTARGQASLMNADTATRNVIARLPGTGSLADEFVVVGAHYDHVGMGGKGSLAPGTIAVHNGADDNGSGTVMLLETARQLSQMKAESRRTILFMAFSAEESGLLGSEHYVENPRWPLDKTVAMINLDMVGRMINDELTVYGTGTATQFPSLLAKTNERYNFRLVNVPEGRGASDHANFFGAKIPVFHFFTGLHNDYHRPSDDVDKINIAGMDRITQFVTDIAQSIAIEPQRPTFINIRGSANPRMQPTARPRVIMGIQLERDSQAEAKLLAVNADGPAARAGLEAGDIILKIDDTSVINSGHLRDLINKSKSGQKVRVTFKRALEEKTTEVTLGS